MGLFSKKKAKPEEAENKKPEFRKPPEAEVEVGAEDCGDAKLMAAIAEKNAKRKIASMLTISLILNVVLLLACCGVVFWAATQRTEVYFTTSADGRLKEIPALDQPLVSNAGISNWTAQAVTETLTLDFRNYGDVLAKVKPYYSEEAWKQLMEFAGEVTEGIKEKRLMLYAVASEAPRLLAQGMVNRTTWGWKLEFPMTITFQGDKTVSDHYIVQVTVGRADVSKKTAGVEILQLGLFRK